MKPAPRYAKLSDRQDGIRDADALLFRGAAFSSLLIRRAGRSDYSHAALALVTHGVVCCAEVREGYGGRVVSLDSQVRKYPGRIDWYRANAFERFDLFDRQAAAQAMLRLAGGSYGWGDIGRVALLHLPVVRMFAEPDTLDRPETASPATGTSAPGPAGYFCSGAVSFALRTGGKVDPVPNLSDRETEPGDLARSEFFIYQNTLIP